MTAARIQPMKAGKRTCLRCSKSFPSSGPGNRICSHCTAVNKGAVYGPIARGEKRHRGETLSTGGR